MSMKINFKIVSLWWQCFSKEGSGYLREVAAGRRHKPMFTPEKVEEVINATLQTAPKEAIHWSYVSMVENQRIIKATDNRIFQRHNLQPHRGKGFKLFRDAKFLEKLTDVVRLYFNPPEKTQALCIAKKSQIKALDCTQLVLPLKKGRCGTMSHDNKRNGTTTLFAALELVQGKEIGQCYAKHLHQEFIKFLKRLDVAFPVALMLHVVLGNSGTHKHHKVRDWLARHSRFVLHFIPMSLSWLNLRARLLAELTGKKIRRGALDSVAYLIAAIEEYLVTWYENPKPFIWTAIVESIIEKLYYYKQVLEEIQPVCMTRRPHKGRKNNSSRLCDATLYVDQECYNF